MDTIQDQCIQCWICHDHCLFLESFDIDPANLELNNMPAETAYACSLCGLCGEVCPEQIDLSRVFQERRKKAISDGEIEAEDCSYLFPDTSDHSIKLYREKHHIDYSDLKKEGSGTTAFFPGCTLLAYAPDLTRAAYRALQSQLGSVVFLEDCCGKVLYQFGLEKRARMFTQALQARLKEQGIERIITACPNCYYYLQDTLPGIKVDTIYQALPPHDAYLDRMATIHDSCPDRKDGIFAEQVRKHLQACGLHMVEMEHAGAETICCGSGGQLRHYYEDFAEELKHKRLQEAQAVQVELMVCYCSSCLLNYNQFFNEHSIEVTHALNVVLNQPNDWLQVSKE